jgi:hypothetical protein
MHQCSPTPARTPHANPENTQSSTVAHSPSPLLVSGAHHVVGTTARHQRNQPQQTLLHSATCHAIDRTAAAWPAADALHFTVSYCFNSRCRDSGDLNAHHTSRRVRCRSPHAMPSTAPRLHGQLQTHCISLSHIASTAAAVTLVTCMRTTPRAECGAGHHMPCHRPHRGCMGSCKRIAFHCLILLQ